MFNEVFFDDVFVPEDCLVGAEHDGWRCARTTLANERVFMGGSNTIGGGVIGAMRAVEARGLADDRLVLAEVGGLAATGHALAVLGFRMTLQSLAGADPSGSEAAVRKLLGVQQDQLVQEVGLSLMGPDAAATDGEAGGVVGGVPVQPVPHHRGRHQRRAAERDRRAPPGPAPGPRARAADRDDPDNSTAAPTYGPLSPVFPANRRPGPSDLRRPADQHG